MRASIFILLGAISITSYAQETQHRDISSLAWLQGSWQSENGDILELWSAPDTNSMLCAFRWFMPSGKTVYEFVMLEEIDGEIYYQFKHFSQGMREWEADAIRLKLEEQADHFVSFRLIEFHEKYPAEIRYRKKNERELVIEVLGHGGESDKFSLHLYKS